MSYALHDFIGNLGLVLLLGTYLMLQMGRIRSTGLLYSALNAAASFCIGFSLIYEFNMSAFLVEVFWFFISAYGILKFILNMRVGKPHED